MRKNGKTQGTSVLPLSVIQVAAYHLATGVCPRFFAAGGDSHFCEMQPSGYRNSRHSKVAV